MGSGGQKAHEAITISPSLAPAADLELGHGEHDDDKCSNCGALLDDGEGWDGLCGSCADVEEAGTTTSRLVDNDAFELATTETDSSPDDSSSVLTNIEVDDQLVGDGSEVLTPVPTEPVVGDMAGYPLIVGGDDLDDASLTLVSYTDDAGGDPREIIYGWVTPEAEHKILDALALDQEQLVPVEVSKNVTGRLPLDEEHDFYGQVETIAKSVNHHLKLGDGIPQHTHDNTEKAWMQLSDAFDDATPDEQKMIASYLGAVEQVAAKLNSENDEDYEVAKIPHIAAYTVDQTVTVTEMVSKPIINDNDGRLPTEIRDTTRIMPMLEPDGTGRWNGEARYSRQGGKEYRIDLGDGYEAVYRPHNASDEDAVHVGQRGFLEIVAPPGAGHGPEMVERLGQLNLGNRPMTGAEAEWTYLQRNIWAQQLEVSSAVADAKTLDDTVAELVFSEQAHKAVGMNDAQLADFAKHIQLEAETRALPEKTRMVREAVAKQLGYSSGDELAASPGYNPIPRRSAGWHVWDRFDVANNSDAVSKEFGDRVLYHSVTGNNIADIFANSGSLVATERRRLMGIQSNIGTSESADMTSGGSRAVDLRVGSGPFTGPTMVWNDPTRLLRRSDWYAYDKDNFGASAETDNWSTSGQTRDPHQVAKFKQTSNEILFRNGIDLTGPEAPDRIQCSSTTQRNQVLSILAAKGITHLGGKPAKDVVTT